MIVTGGHGETAVDHLFDGSEHVEIPVERHEVAATHGAGCTHSATLTALLAAAASRCSVPLSARLRAASEPSVTAWPSSAPARGPSTSST